jgi:nucleoside phosphorylase
MLGAMLLIVAAMGEELDRAMVLFPDREIATKRGLTYWQTRRGNNKTAFFKAGIGPRRSSANMERIFGVLTPDRVLLIGYAGALDPNLKVGDLIGVKKAFACSLDENHSELSHLKLDRQFELKDAGAIADTAKSLGLRADTGDTLTSAYVLGDPAHKRLLYEKHHASIVDMETAAIAAVVDSRNIPFSCARSISDEATDTFLMPFSYNTSDNLATRAVKIIGSGVQIYQDWKTNAKIAGETLKRFLAGYL